MPSPDSRGHGIPLFGHLERKKTATVTCSRVYLLLLNSSVMKPVRANAASKGKVSVGCSPQ